MKQRSTMIIAVLSLTAACSDSTGPNNDSAGSLSFTFTGGGGGSYSATGEAPSMNLPSAHTSTWSVGAYSGSNAILILSNQAITGGLANSAVLVIDRRTTGSSEISTTCEPTGTSPCSMLSFTLGADETGEEFAYTCGLTTGTITISAASSTSVTGTFSGVGFCASPTFEFSEATVSGGTFEIPLISGLSFGM